MATTTLVTFLFECPVAARTVEILGSWDNFGRPYQLKRDTRRGSCTWSGCFTFEDIICDGDLNDLSSRRDGALRAGGIYWYYYKVNDEEEHHNPCQPSTTFCPLLPGQRLNILEVPMESRSSLEGSDTFTRNPNDRYLTPVPPKPILSPRLGDLCKEAYHVPMYTFAAPRSATYPPSTRLPSPGSDHYPRSASTSPCLASSAVFSDFRSLKDKIAASKRAAPSSRGGVRELEIGAPVLMSTTAEDINLVSLPSAQIPRTSSSLPPLAIAKFREFSPLGSHPVDPSTDFDFGFTGSSHGSSLKRSRSHVRSIVPSDTASTLGRPRANSSGIRRTKLFPNEPWISSPRLPRNLDLDSEKASAPVLQRPTFTLAPPPRVSNERPTSSHGDDRNSSLRKSTLDKELPALPRYLVPAPLFACSSATPSPTLQDAQEEEEEEEEEPITPVSPELKSHFSMWSTGSTTFGSPATDEDVIHSPTFSSLTSDSSVLESPQRLSDHFAHGEHTYKHDDDLASENVLTDEADYTSAPKHSSGADGPPILRLPVPSFGSDFFNFDAQRPASVSRRHATCFGLEFQGYSLPEEANSSQVTITKTSPQLQIQPARESSTSQLEQLMSDFGYLGEAVL